MPILRRYREVNALLRGKRRKLQGRCTLLQGRIWISAGSNLRCYRGVRIFHVFTGDQTRWYRGNLALLQGTRNAPAGGEMRCCKGVNA